MQNWGRFPALHTSQLPKSLYGKRMNKQEDYRDNPWADDNKTASVKAPIDIAHEALLTQYEEHETCHSCHFIATVLTAGVWLIPWMVFAYVNADRRYEIEEALDKMGLPDNEGKKD